MPPMPNTVGYGEVQLFWRNPPEKEVFSDTEYRIERIYRPQAISHILKAIK